MNAQNVRSGYAFARNPIVVRTNFPSDAQDYRGGNFIVNFGGSDVYTGRFFPPLAIDLSEIADAYVTPFVEPRETRGEPIIEIEDKNELECRRMRVRADYAGYEENCDLMVLPGGISNQNYRRYADTGSDVFTERLFNLKSNFFLTTRTVGWRIVMKETEVFPLYFVLPEDVDDIILKDGVSGEIIDAAGYNSGVYALDIDATRRIAVENLGRLPNIIDVHTDSGFACRIIVERSDVSRERYRLKFRNSLGVFEIIELTGELTIKPRFVDASESQFKRYDRVTGLFRSDRERVEREQSIVVEVGFKRPEEQRFLMDMIGSEEVYLLDLTPFPIRVIPSVEDFAYSPRPETPQSYTINLDVADSEVNLTQDIIDGTEGHKPRVFSKQFTEQFN